MRWLIFIFTRCLWVEILSITSFFRVKILQTPSTVLFEPQLLLFWSVHYCVYESSATIPQVVVLHDGLKRPGKYICRNAYFIGLSLGVESAAHVPVSIIPWGKLRKRFGNYDFLCFCVLCISGLLSNQYDRLHGYYSPFCCIEADSRQLRALHASKVSPSGTEQECLKDPAQKKKQTTSLGWLWFKVCADLNLAQSKTEYLASDLLAELC